MILNIIYSIKYFPDEGKRAFKNKVRKVISKIIKEEGQEMSSINIMLSNDKFVRDYNKKFLKHDYETDILTFYDFNKGRIEGEILISLETVEYNSKRFRVKLSDELMRVIVHGILHLSGYNDNSGKEKKIMREKENYYLKYKQ